MTKLSLRYKEKKLTKNANQIDNLEIEVEVNWRQKHALKFTTKLRENFLV